MKTIVKTTLILLLSICLPQLLSAQSVKKVLPPAKDGPSGNAIDDYSMFNINNVSLRLYADGNINNALDANNNNLPAVVYPRGKTSVIYSSGLIWGGRVLDGDSTKPAIRTGGQRWSAATIPGPILQSGPDPIPGDPDFPVYRIRRDWQSLTGSSIEILRDAADLYGVELSEVTPQQAQQVLDDYVHDWNNWPVHLGAPYEDLNNNGSYEPSIDRPGIAHADQVLWTVCNDLDTSRSIWIWGSPPIGLEIQTTIWGYARPNSSLNEMIFQRYRIINKSGFPIDSMFVGKWTDVDIGSFNDDLISSDSSREMTYGYNGKSIDTDFAAVGLAPAAFGHSLLQGPTITASEDSATIGFRRISGFKNLNITSSQVIAGFGQGKPPYGYELTEKWYNVLNGYVPSSFSSPPIPWYIGSGPQRGSPTHFPLNGNPVNTQGDVDGYGDNLPPGDRRMGLHSGPFSMQPGDMQEIIIAGIGGLGGTHLESIVKLRENYTVAHGLQKSLFEDIPTRVDFQTRVDYLSETFSRIRFRAVNSDATEMRLTLRQLGGQVLAEMDLFDDGNHNDGAANDGVWGNDYVMPPYPMGLSADLDVTYDGFDFCWEGIAENISTSGPVEVTNFFIGSDNLNRDGIVNPGEDVRYTLEVSNTGDFDYTAVNLIQLSSPQPDIVENLNMRLRYEPLKVETLPANSSFSWPYDTTSNAYFSFRINPAYAGNDSIQLVFRFADTSGNAWLDTLSVFVEQYQNPPQDYLMTKTAGSAEGNLGYRVVDPAALTGDSYKVSFNDTTHSYKVQYEVKNLNTDSVLASMQDFPDVLTHNTNPIDGFIITPGTLPRRTVVGPWEWFGGERWLTGVNWGGQTFWGGASLGGDFFGTTLGRADSNYSEVRIDFDPNITTNANVFRRDMGYSHAGLGTFYGAAYDIEDPANPRRLNIAFVEDGSLKPADLIWNPDSMNSGAREYLFIMDSDYDPIDGGGYTETGIIFGGTPTVWGLWTQLKRGFTFLESSGSLELYLTRGADSGTTFEFTPEYFLGSEEEEQIIQTFNLEQNYPNPFNPTTSIRFQIPKSVKTTLTIYNVLGQKVKTLVNDKLSAGSYTMRWKGVNDFGNTVGSGVYFYRIEAGDFVKTRKMLLVK
ncbi:MAG: T9SS type A sorting domain-containing protein [Calditrichia bacterium]